MKRYHVQGPPLTKGQKKNRRLKRKKLREREDQLRHGQR